MYCTRRRLERPVADREPGHQRRDQQECCVITSADPAGTLHFIPTYSSWLNQVERFFTLINEKTIRRGSFSKTRASLVTN
jgi:transposase